MAAAAGPSRVAGDPALCAPHPQASGLLELQRKSGGVIDLDEKAFEQFVVGKDRPYTIVLVAGEPQAGGVARHLP